MDLSDSLRELAQQNLSGVAFATITAIHFVLYSWLYQTPLYIGMAVLIALGTITAMATAPDNNDYSGPKRVCIVTGCLLLSTAAVFFVRLR